ncbi:MAG: phosphatase PAP2 family protein [Flavobacteriales bacterium]|nr:phosphatase PAP2 family protein [Flavobacteriales bacterium]
MSINNTTTTSKSFEKIQLSRFFSYFEKNYVLLYAFLLIIIATYFAVIIPKGVFLTQLNSSHSPFLDIFFKYVTYLGDTLIYIPIAFTLFFYHKRKIKYLVLLLITQTAFTWLFKKILLKGMPRPKEFFSENVFNHFHKVSGVDIHSWNTFPSGHTMTAFALAFFFILNPKTPKTTQITLFPLACLVGLSRVYLLQHFYIDICFGAIFGILSAYITLHLHLKIPSLKFQNIRSRILK